MYVRTPSHWPAAGAGLPEGDGTSVPHCGSSARAATSSTTSRYRCSEGSIRIWMSLTGPDTPPHSGSTPRSSGVAASVPESGYQMDSGSRDIRSSTDTTSTSRRSEEHTSELQSRGHLVCRLLLEKKKTQQVPNRALPHRWLLWPNFFQLL